jgi:hypothetical protein
VRLLAGHSYSAGGAAFGVQWIGGELMQALVRQAGGTPNITSQNEVRLMVSEYRKLDSANFATHISEMENDFQLVGKGKKRQLKVSRPGWEKAKQLVNSLGGGED